jgi:murein DD-endopeptidase MepM/ murein hydrolase activator NlpD
MALAAILAAAAYLAGAALAQRLLEPPSALPGPTQIAAQVPLPVAAVQLAPGDPVEGTLNEGDGDEWQFQGRAGQSVTVETWLHPGSGSSVEAELAVHLIGPEGTVLASETGSVFLPPYLVAPGLPADGLYRVQVASASGAPGRYSLLLTFSDAPAPVTPGTPPPQQPTAVAAIAFQGQFTWPSAQRAISGWTFHDPRNPGHIGLDIAASMWDPIVAVADGVVVFADWGGGYGNLVIVEHGADWRSYYAHLSEIVVKLGQEVRQEELLGGAGSTGYSTGPHLHFELRYQGRPVDPHIHLP